MKTKAEKQKNKLNSFSNLFDTWRPLNFDILTKYKIFTIYYMGHFIKKLRLKVVSPESCLYYPIAAFLLFVI
jgi:hypothetical protein